MMLFLLWYLTIFHHLCQKKFPSLLHSAYLIKLHDKQECIPIGCIPPASVASMSVLGGGLCPHSQRPPSQRPPLLQRPLSQRPPFTETLLHRDSLDRDPPRQRYPWTETPLDWEPPCPWTEPALDRAPWDPLNRDPPPHGQRPPAPLDRDHHTPPHQTPCLLQTETPLWTDKTCENITLPQTSFAGGNKSNMGYAEEIRMK